MSAFTVELSLTPAQLALAFSEMGDEEQAQFFIEVARIAGTWSPAQNFLQWRSVGRHLSTCKCSNDAARDLVLEIAEGITA